MKTKTASPLLFVAACVALPFAAVAGAGCAGGGATSLGTNPASLSQQSLPDSARNASGGITAPAGATQRAGVFITGAAPAGYDHAWVTVHKIEVIDTAEKAATIWEDRDGQSIDLGILQDKIGPRYALVTSAAVPSGRAHTRIRVTLGKAALLYKPKATVAETLLLSDSLPRDDEGRPTLSYSLKKAHDLGSGKDPIVIAFDAKKFTVNEGRAKLVASDGSANAKQGLSDVTRQEPALFTGTVGDIAKATGEKTGTETTFTLQEADGQSVVVEVASGVPITDESGAAIPAAEVKATAVTATPEEAKKASVSPAPSPSASAAASAVATGKIARVRGTLSLSTKRIVATEIVLRASTPVAKEGQTEEGTPATPAAAEASVVGEATEVKAEAGSFTIVPRQVYGLVPSQSSITVVLGKGAALRSLGGSGAITPEDLLSSLKRTGVQVEATGAFDPITATLTASRVTLNTTSASPSMVSPTAATKVSQPPVDPSQL
jgi:hypothetical protein